MSRSVKVINNPCNIYILTWLLLHLQNNYLNSSFVSMIFYLPFLGMTIYYVTKVFTYKTNGFMNALSLFFIVLLFYGIGLLILNNATGQVRYSFLKVIFSSLGPIFAFYDFTKQGLLTERRMIGWVVFLVAIATIEYYGMMQRKLIELESMGSDREEITNNASYGILGLFPFVYLLRKKPVLQFVFVGYIMYFVIYGLKRGAIITGLLLIVWFIYTVTSNSKKRRRSLIMFLTIILLLFGWNYINRYYLSSEYFQFRVESTMEGVSSNREWIYATLLQHFRDNQNAIQQLFGEGAYHTETLIGLKAHNDWLELLIDCGVFGVLIYIIYWFCFIRDFIKSKSDYLIFSMLGACFIYTFVRTLFSMSFTDVPFTICMIMGFCFASMNNNTQTSIKTEK